jgi:hypothetical protein
MKAIECEAITIETDSREIRSSQVGADRCRAALLSALVVSALMSALAAAEASADPQRATAALQANKPGIASGKVMLAGPYHKPPPLPVFKNRSFCGSAVSNETLVVDALGGVANTVVMFVPLGGPARPKPARLILDNVGCAFVPHVQVAPIGSELVLKNSDPILHTVHARLGSATLFNVGLPRWRQITKQLDRPGPVRIDCDVLHTWMSAVIMVVETPFFAVTDNAGRFTIDDLPPAEYRMTIWHERLGAQTRLVSTEATANFEMIFRAPKLR